MARHLQRVVVSASLRLGTLFDHNLGNKFCRIPVKISGTCFAPATKIAISGKPMIESQTVHAKNASVARAFVDRVRAATRDQIRGLDVDCDGEVVTIRGEVDSSDLERLAFNAAWIEARNGECLLFDLQVEVIAPREGKGVSPA
jgi:hypothetical protein